MKIELTPTEIEALQAAAGNVDPCMFVEDVGGRRGLELAKALDRARNKLFDALEAREARRRT